MVSYGEKKTGRDIYQKQIWEKKKKVVEMRRH